MSEKLDLDALERTVIGLSWTALNCGGFSLKASDLLRLIALARQRDALLEAAREILPALEEDFEGEHSDDWDNNDSVSGSLETDNALTFGHIRLRAAIKLCEEP